MASYEDLERNIDMVGIEQALQKIDLDDDQHIEIEGKEGARIEAKGGGTLFVGYLPH